MPSVFLFVAGDLLCYFFSEWQTSFETSQKLPLVSPQDKRASRQVRHSLFFESPSVEPSPQASQDERASRQVRHSLFFESPSVELSPQAWDLLLHHKTRPGMRLALSVQLHMMD